MFHFLCQIKKRGDNDILLTTSFMTEYNDIVISIDSHKQKHFFFVVICKRRSIRKTGSE